MIGSSWQDGNEIGGVDRNVVQYNVIELEGAKVVKQIYREYLEGSSLKQISIGPEAYGILTAANMKR